MGGRTAHQILTVCLGLAFLTGCAVDTTEPQSQVGEATEGRIAYRVWEKPVDIALGEPIDGTVAYSECAQVEPTSEDVDIQIECKQAWTEVAWYRISGELLAQALAEGATELYATFTSEHLLRASIHRAKADGDDGADKLTTSKAVFDGDTLSVPLETSTDHFIYVGKGATLNAALGHRRDRVLAHRLDVERAAQLDV